MRVILHDLSIEERAGILEPNLREDDYVIERKGQDPKNCMGCFGCWLKTPGICVLKDGEELNGARLGAADEFIIISRCRYGEFSPQVKKYIDRCVPYIHPHFIKRNGETHHRLRYTNHVPVKVYFYGEELSDSEIQCMKDRVVALGINIGSSRATAQYILDLNGGITL